MEENKFYQFKEELRKALLEFKNKQVEIRNEYGYPFVVVSYTVFKSLKHSGLLLCKTEDKKYWYAKNHIFGKVVIVIAKKPSHWVYKNENKNWRKLNEYTRYNID